jgi:hypothetical protein
MNENINTLIKILSSHNISIRVLELLTTLDPPATPGQIEYAIDMDRITLLKMYRRNKQYICKTQYHPVPKSRGKTPVIYGLTPAGADLLVSIRKLLR